MGIEKKKLGKGLVGGVSVAGVLVAWHLSQVHVQGQIGESASSGLCNAGEFINCDAAAQSSFSTILGIPIAVIGLAFYVAMIVAVFWPGKGPGKSKSKSKGKGKGKGKAVVSPSVSVWSPAAMAVSLFGLSLVYSVFLLVVSLAVLHSLCPFCAMLYGVNLGGFVAAWIWYGDKPHRALMGQLGGFKGVLAERAPVLFGVAFFASLLLGLGVIEMSVNKGLAIQAQADAARASMGPVDASRVRASHTPSVGPVEAPVVIVEFSNFPCPHCGRLAQTLKQVREQFPDKVRVEYRHFPFAQQAHGHLAAQAGVCAGEQGKFWPMHDAMFAGAPALSRPDLLRYGAQVGLDVEALDACIDGDLARRVVAADVAAGQALGIQGTPTFFINGERISGALPYQEIVARIEKHLR